MVGKRKCQAAKIRNPGMREILGIFDFGMDDLRLGTGLLAGRILWECLPQITQMDAENQRASA